MTRVLIHFFIFAVTTLGSSLAWTQEGGTSALFREPLSGKEEWFWGLSYLRWSESMRLQKNTFVGMDTANFAGLNLNLERQMSYNTWGWSAGLFFGSGRATGGGNSSLVTYQRNNEAWTAFGVSAKVFHRWSSRISAGAAVPMMIRNIEWLNPDGMTEVSSGQNLNLGLLFDLVLRVNKKLDFYQEIGILNSQGSTLWKVGLNVRI